MIIAASASGPPEYLTQIVALVGAAAVIGYLCARLRVVPIVGFLLAGVLIGPSVLGVVREREVVDAAAEVGVILLLFTIGIEFSLGRLMAIRRTVLLGGAVQVGGAVTVVTGICVAAGVVVLTLVVARRVMPVVLEAVARACSPEVFLLSVIALCLGTAYLTALAGVSVSLGAFLAGLVVSESRHSAHALGEVLPLQIVFSAVFFLSIGTLLDVGFLVEEPLLVLAAVALVVVVKTVTTGLAALAVGLPLATAGSVALLLAQVGEFAFVLERAGAAEGLSPAGLGERGAQAFLAATVVLLVATPGLAAVGHAWAGRAPRAASTPTSTAGQSAPAAGHVLVSGWGRAARELTAALTAAGDRVVVTTLNPDGAAEAERAGLEVVRGDSTKAHVLHEAGAGQARVVVIADDEPGQAAHISGVVVMVAPQASVVVLAPHPDDVPELHEAGASRVVLSHRAAHDRLVTAVRDLLHVPPTPGRTVVDVNAVVAFRADPESACAHAGTSRPVVPTAAGCTDCLRTGDEWVHLRMCTSCGHVGCCDSSPGRHAAAHARAAEHPVMCSVEPADDWGWCYLDDVMLRASDG